jgi:hypothetical protein
MQSIATMNLQRIDDHAQRTRALNDAAKRLVQRVLGCWQHDLSRPFSHRGRTYRVCVKCGMARDFNPVDWKTHGPSYRLPANPGYGNSMSIERKAA